MLTLGQQKIDVVSLALVTALVAVAVALGVAQPRLMPLPFVALAGAAVLLYWAVRWDVTIWAWIWVLSYGLVDRPFWSHPIAGFFNMTIPRYLFVVLFFAFLGHMLLRRWRLRYDRALLWAMLALLVYCALSATATGWTARVLVRELHTAPYFRFLGAMLLPFIMFFFVYNATHRERHIRWALVLLNLYGWYAIYIGYLQYAAVMGAPGARAFIWPGYINDAGYGIHFDRARGAFYGAGPQAIFLVLLFFIDWYLVRRTRGPYRASLVVQALLIPPAIFFTGMRSAYVAFALCGVIWLIWAGRGRFGWSKLGIAVVLVAAGAAMFWANLAQTRRQTGGVAQTGPILARLALLDQTWDIWQSSPVFGVGFGHFVDAQQQLPRDPGSRAGLRVGLLAEHNLFLSMLAETGVVGLAAIVLVFVLVFRQSVQLYRKLPVTAEGDLSPALVVLFWIALANYLVDAMLRDTLWDVFANALFWSFAGLVAGYNRLLEPHPIDLPVAASAVQR
jgi:hypothetical protein